MSRLHPMLERYEPTGDNPWDRSKAAHLLNRAGFGGTQAEISKVVELGPIRAVDSLLDFPDAGAEEESEKDVPDLSGIEGYPKTFREIQRQLIGKTEDERRNIRQMFQVANRE